MNSPYDSFNDPGGLFSDPTPPKSEASQRALQMIDTSTRPFAEELTSVAVDDPQVLQSLNDGTPEERQEFLARGYAIAKELRRPADFNALLFRLSIDFFKVLKGMVLNMELELELKKAFPDTSTSLPQEFFDRGSGKLSAALKREGGVLEDMHMIEYAEHTQWFIPISLKRATGFLHRLMDLDAYPITKRIVESLGLPMKDIVEGVLSSLGQEARYLDDSVGAFARSLGVTINSVVLRRMSHTSEFEPGEGRCYHVDSEVLGGKVILVKDYATEAAEVRKWYARLLKAPTASSE